MTLQDDPYKMKDFPSQKSLFFPANHLALYKKKQKVKNINQRKNTILIRKEKRVQKSVEFFNFQRKLMFEMDSKGHC